MAKRTPATKRKITPRPRKAPQASRARKIDPGWTWDDRVPLSQGIQTGSTIYVSGQVPYAADGQLVGSGDVAAQTRQCLENVRAVLEAAGAGVGDIVKITTYLTDSSRFMEMMRVRAEFFGGHLPA